MEFESVEYISRFIFSQGDFGFPINSYIYRGQGTFAEWEVLPSLIRNKEVIKNSRVYDMFFYFKKQEKDMESLIPLNSEYVMRGFEMEQSVDAHRVLVKGDSLYPNTFELDKYLHQDLFGSPNIEGVNYFDGEWPNESILPFLAYQQHIGLPTRLLDATSDLLTAMYFSLKQAMENKTFGIEDSEVIMINTHFLDMMKFCGFKHDFNIYPPNAMYNKNSILQKGLLLYFAEPSIGYGLTMFHDCLNTSNYLSRLNDIGNDYLRYLDSDEIDENRELDIESLKEDFLSKPFIIRARIPHSIHLELYEFLGKVNRTANYLFHGNDAVRFHLQDNTYVKDYMLSIKNRNEKNQN